MNATMKSHIELLGWINIISGAFMLLIGALVVVALFFFAPVTDRQAAIVLPVIAIVVGSVLGLISIGQIITGIGLLKRTPWARVLALVVAVFALFSFPIGTIIAIYSFWVLTREETQQLLRGAM